MPGGERDAGARRAVMLHPTLDPLPVIMPVVNDVHSQLNPTDVLCVMAPRSLPSLAAAVRGARASGRAVSVAGGRHAMGGQQFGADTVLIDTTALRAVRHFDAELGTVEVQAGVQWPDLMAELARLQDAMHLDEALRWGIAQKQTGADRLSIGGALAANAHGRGLTMAPFVENVEAFTIVDAIGDIQRCSRTENADLFRLAIGGYGLFGIVATITLRLRPRVKVQRDVEVRTADGLMAAFDQRVAGGALYGDFQFAIDPTSEDFLHRGVFSTYRPVDLETPIPEDQRSLSLDDWTRLLTLAHTDKRQAFERYAEHYLGTAGQIYWSDTHQLTEYVDDYHRVVDRATSARDRATEVITEIYVPRHRLTDFLAAAGEDFRQHAVEVIYGTVRLIERDTESFLAWAKERYACIIFNLHTVHTPEGQARSADAFRRLIDLAIARDGSYYLTYHRHARRDQVEAAYPQFAEFLEQKRHVDPEERFQSDWYRHYRQMFGAE